MIIGIDPGLAGAVAVLSNDDVVIDIFDMPTIKSGTKNFINRALLHYTLKSHVDSATDATTVFIEAARPVPKSGEQASFAFGMSYDVPITIATCLGLRVEYIEPKAWKAANNLKGGKDQKKHSITRAIQLYPDQCYYFTRVKDSDRAEALLIARFGLDKTRHGLNAIAKETA